MAEANYGGYCEWRGSLDWNKRREYDSFYRRRHHSSIGHVTPVDFEMQYSLQAAVIQLAA